METSHIHEILQHIAALPLEDQAAIAEILNKRIHDLQRAQLAARAKEAEAKSRNVTVGNVDDLMKITKLQTDGAGHLYAEVENIRITYIPAKDRAPGKDWAGSDVLRIQSYRGADDHALNMGAEVPIASPAMLGELVAAISQLYIEGITELY